MAAPFRNSLAEIGWLKTIIKSFRDLKSLKNQMKKFTLTANNQFLK
jgi:hypothetical protein